MPRHLRRVSAQIQVLFCIRNSHINLQKDAHAILSGERCDVGNLTCVIRLRDRVGAFLGQKREPRENEWPGLRVGDVPVDKCQHFAGTRAQADAHQ